MNQILITGEEAGKVGKVKKEKQVLPINGIVVFFAISIMILGICMICGSVYSKNKINETVAANTKPQVEINRNDEDNTVEINVKHIRGITKIAYKWNNEKENIIDGKNSKNISKTIDLIGGKNTLTVMITEENGQTVTYEKTYTVGNIPEIDLEAVSNGIKLTATSEVGIDYISYNWDDGEEQKIELGDKKTYEGVINVPMGEHRLKIEVVDINGMKAKNQMPIVVDIEPTVTVEAAYVDGKIAFIIDASDDEEITTIEITHNDGEKRVINVNGKTYHEEVIMTDGEWNTLIVTVTNKNKLSNRIGTKFDMRNR